MASHTVSQQGNNFLSSTGLSNPDAATVIQGTINVMKAGDVLTIKAATYPISNELIYIPNVDGLTVQGEGESTVLDSSQNPRWNEKAATIDGPNPSSQLSIIGRSNEDAVHRTGAARILSLIIKNLKIVGAYTTTKYLSRFNSGIYGTRCDNVDSLTIENIHAESVGASIGCRNIGQGLISGINSIHCGAGPTIVAPVSNLRLENCYTYRSFDDSFAHLGVGLTNNIVYNNCVANKGSAPDNDSPGVGATCFKLEGDKHTNISYINCKALNGKKGIGRDSIIGGFTQWWPTLQGPVTYQNCIVDNCEVGFQLAGKTNTITNCSALRCTRPRVDFPNNLVKIQGTFRTR